MLTLEALRKFGANVDEGLARCMNNEAFYLKMVHMELEDKNFGLLAERLSQNDLDGAFAAAHALKGVLANLALTPLFAPASELTELLRHKTPGDYDALMQRVLAQRDALAKLAE